MDKRLKTRPLSKCRKKSYSGSFRTQKKESNLKFLWLILAIPLIVIILIIFFLFSSFFNLKTTEIQGVDDYKKEKIEIIINNQIKSKNLFFSQENLVFFKKDKLLKDLDDFNFSNIIIKKNIFKKSLTIELEEREKAIIFYEGDYYFFADKDGNIINSQIDCGKIVLENDLSSNSSNTESTEEERGEVSLDDFQKLDQSKQLEIEEIKNCLDFNEKYRKENLFPFIENVGRERVTDNKKNIKIDSSYIDFSLKLYNDLSEDSEFGLNRIVLDEEYNTIKARLNNNIDLYFSFKEDYMEQVSRFFALKRERGAELKAQKYIDLRYGDKIFYY
ncbi:MAG: hypothetical protein PHP37_00210 [Patescibacteria group bacterium]|nr:hypothetical protein [Patescibacteria group bacterium]